MGVVLWEALAGRPLYTGASDADVLYKVHKAEVAPLDRERADLPPRLTQIVHRALAPTPAGRFPSARDMAQALAAVLASAPGPTDTQALLSQAVTQTRAQIVHGTSDPVESEIMQLSVTDLEPQ